MTQEGFKRKLTAILSADVEGYSRLMGEDEDATIRTLTSYRELMTTLIQKHRGRVVDSPGDNLLAEFLSVVDAVRCAVEIQEELRVRNAELPENRRMHFRIGINLGDVVQEEERIYGDGINIAARVEGLAEGGGICISGTVYDSIKNKLSLSYESLGEHTVKNITEPVRVYRMRVGPEAAVKPRPRYWHKAALAALVVLIVAAGAWAIWNFYFRPPPMEPASVEKMALPLPDLPSIAVLPFTNMSDDPKQEFLSDGITESIIYTLSYLPGMFVIARNSTFTYKGKPVEIRQVAEELGVRYVLEGSVMREKDRVRVTAQLIDAISGYHIWSGRFDRTMNDFFSLLDEITKTIAIELKVKVSEQWFDLSRKTNVFDAWASATRAYSLFTRGGGKNVVEAHGLAEKAVTLDPKYGFGWAILTAIHIVEILYGVTESPAESLKLAAECNEKALTLDPTLSCATASRGQIYMLQGRIEEAVAFGEKAIAMAPRLETNHLIMAVILEFAGRFEEAIAYYKNVMRLNPFYPGLYLRRYGMSCLMAGRHEEALTVFKEVLGRAQRGEYPPLFIHLGLCAVYAELGNKEEARTHASEILKIDPNFSLVAARKAYRWKDPSNTERWLSSLRKAGMPDTPPLPLPDKPSIAVLPFTNISGDPKQEYLSDGITEQIIASISKIHRLFVIARTSSFKYKGTAVDVQQVGRELGVKYVLEGSVQRSGNRLRITAQLIDAKTGNHLWAERYDRELKEIFAVQDEIAKKIITALQIKLTHGEKARVWAKSTNNLEAYLKFIEGAGYFTSNFAEKRSLFEEAIELDPQFATAYCWLAYTHLMDVWFGPSTSRSKSFKKGFESAEKGIAIDDSQAFCHAMMAQFYLMKRQYDKASAEGEKAVALNLNDSLVAMWYGMTLRSVGRYEEAISIIQRAIRLDPFNTHWPISHLASTYLLMRRHEDAIETYNKALKLFPKMFTAYVGLAIAYSSLDRIDEARSAASEVLRLYPNFSVVDFEKTLPYKNQADRKFFINGLHKAGLK